MSVYDFDKKGFLSNYVYSHRAKVLDLYAIQFDECGKLSEQAQSLVVNSKVKETDRSKICSLLFAERTLRGCQAAIRLCEIGMVQEAQVLTRTALETMFHSSALLVKPEIVDDVFLNDEHEARKFAESILKDVSEDQFSQEDKDYLEALRERSIGKQYSVYDSAKIAGMSRKYAVEYRFLSAMAGHATIRSLDRSLAPEESGYAFYMGPSENQLELTLSIVAHCLEQCVYNLKFLMRDLK